MKTILLNMLALLVIIGIALPMVGDTMATWSDSETSEGNYIETGSIDLLVAKCDDNWGNCSDFSDDLPWGTGLFTKRTDDGVVIVPGFDIPDGHVSTSYDCNLLLWNAGCVDGMAYIHVKIVEDNQELAKTMDMDIWYDLDGDGAIENDGTQEELVVSDRIYNLACKSIQLGPLLSEEAPRKLRVEIHAHGGSTDDSLTFSIQFELFGPYFIDTKESLYNLGDTEESPDNYFRLKELP